MRLYLVGEGPTDIGDLATEKVWRPEKALKEGFLQPVIRNLRPHDSVRFDGQKITQLGKERFSDLRAGLSRQAEAAYLIAARENHDVVVVTHDVDRLGQTKASKREAARKTREVRQAIQLGLDSAAAASDKRLQAVIGTPCRCIEAWALSDPDALRKAADLKTPPPITRAPEELTGAPHDPASNHPKCVLNRIFRGRLEREAYAAIAESADPAVLRSRCPATFVPFADDIESLTL